MSLMTKIIARSTTNRIAKGILKQIKMTDEEFTELINKSEKEFQKTGEYEIPNWFTIQLKQTDNNLFNFIGTFHGGNDYNKVDKDLLFNVLKENNIKYEKINDKEEIYKIIRH